jgi:Phage tail tube protein
MAFASSKFITLSGQEESTYGVQPASGNFKFLPNTEINFNYSKETITSNTVDQTRQTKDLIPTGFSVSGGFNFEFAPKVFDEIIEGVMWTRWGTPITVPCSIAVDSTTRRFTTSVAANTFANVVAGQYIRIAGALLNPANTGIFRVAAKISNLIIETDAGTSMVTETVKTGCTITANMIRNPATMSVGQRISYYFEKANTDMSPVQRFSYSGCMVNLFSLSVQSKSVVTGSFDFLGKASEIYGPLTRSFAAVTGPIATDAFNTLSHVRNVRINGALLSATSTFLQGFEFSIGHSLRGVPAIGVLGNAEVNPGLISVTGKMSPYFASSDMYTKFLASTKFSMSFELIGTNGDGYIFSFPQCVIGNDDMSGEDVVENLSWSAVVDPTYGTSMQIDRFYALYTDCPDTPPATHTGT